MPEILEAEYYRRTGEQCLGRPIRSVDAPDEWFLKRGTTGAALDEALTGEHFTEARRHGKVVLLDVSSGETVGLRFGMTGRLIVDDSPVIDRLEYSPHRDEPVWDRFRVNFDRGGLRLQDPRRLGGVELDPDESLLGIDAWSVDAAVLADVLGDSSAPLKTRLMDQRRLAGLGNLLTDEILWRSRLAPTRWAGALTAAERETLASTIVSTLDELDGRGGSHTGDLQEERSRDGHCPIDGTPLTREPVGGRTTYWCLSHQR